MNVSERPSRITSLRTVSGLGAQRHSHADFSGALADEERDYAVDSYDAEGTRATAAKVPNKEGDGARELRVAAVRMTGMGLTSAIGASALNDAAELRSESSI